MQSNFFPFKENKLYNPILVIVTKNANWTVEIQNHFWKICYYRPVGEPWTAPAASLTSSATNKTTFKKKVRVIIVRKEKSLRKKVQLSFFSKGKKFDYLFVKRKIVRRHFYQKEKSWLSYYQKEKSSTVFLSKGKGLISFLSKGKKFDCIFIQREKVWMSKF